ncbi:MAG: hypothetical protein RLZZ303_2364 [Candidatus Hydrogenedentota bacterium]|jgi:hypothetical protein
MRIFCLVSLLVVSLLAGCASTPESSSPDATAPGRQESAPTKARANVSTPSGKVTIEQPLTALVDIVRLFGQQEAGGIVLMHGLGFETAGPFSWNNRAFNDAVADFATAAGINVSMNPAYAFLHPQGYEILNDWTVPELPGGAAVASGVALGHGTKLSSAAAFLSHITGVTILVDNVVADARTGEMWLPSLPLHTVLEAVLKGARVPPSSVRVSVAERMVMIQTVANKSELQRIGPGVPELEARATVYLPSSPARPQLFSMSFEARTLSEVLPALSAQLGIPVEAASGFGELPVEQCVFVDQPRDAILRGLIAQWPAPGIGYRWTGSGVIIERFSTAP